jgi:hypothetical protein
MIHTGFHFKVVLAHQQTSTIHGQQGKHNTSVNFGTQNTLNTDFFDGSFAQSKTPPFQYPSASHPYLRAFRTSFKLDSVVQNGTHLYEKALKLNTWVNQQWVHGNENPKNSDATSILREAQAGGHFPCYAYARVLNACLNAMGIPARSVGLKTQDVETRLSGAGHVVVEAWIDTMQKWVMFDPTVGGVFEKDGIPLDIAELKDAMTSDLETIKAVAMKPEWNNPPCIAWYLKDFMKKYLFYWDAALDQLSQIQGKSDLAGLMYVPYGAGNPKIFQGKEPLNQYVYTNRLEAFKIAPEKCEDLMR